MFKKIKRLLLIFILSIILLFGAGFFYLYHWHYVTPILMYHSVNPQATYENRLSVRPDTFERQLRFLKMFRYRVLTLEQVAALLRQGKKVPKHSVVITFDDGYKDNYTYAFGLLKKYRLPATIFVIIQEVGRSDRLSWEEIKRMHLSGLVTFGSHALGPEPLVNIQSNQEIKRQIFESKKILEQKLGTPVTLFSYPEGRFTPKIRQLVREAGYQAAVATSISKDYPNDDVFALKRIRISENSRNLFVFWIESCGIYTFIKERRHK